MCLVFKVVEKQAMLPRSPFESLASVAEHLEMDKAIEIEVPSDGKPAVLQSNIAVSLSRRFGTGVFSVKRVGKVLYVTKRPPKETHENEPGDQHETRQERGDQSDHHRDERDHGGRDRIGDSTTEITGR